MKRIAIGIALVAALGSTAMARPRLPIPHTPCAAESNGRHPSEHLRYWLVNDWRLTQVGWVNADGDGCYL